MAFNYSASNFLTLLQDGYAATMYIVMFAKFESHCVLHHLLPAHMKMHAENLLRYFELFMDMSC